MMTVLHGVMVSRLCDLDSALPAWGRCHQAVLVPLGAISRGERWGASAQHEGGEELCSSPWPGGRPVSLLLGEQEGEDVSKGRSRQDVCGR